MNNHKTAVKQRRKGNGNLKPEQNYPAGSTTNGPTIHNKDHTHLNRRLIFRVLFVW